MQKRQERILLFLSSVALPIPALFLLSLFLFQGKPLTIERFELLAGLLVLQAGITNIFWLLYMFHLQDCRKFRGDFLVRRVRVSLLFSPGCIMFFSGIALLAHSKGLEKIFTYCSPIAVLCFLIFLVVFPWEKAFQKLFAREKFTKG